MAIHQHPRENLLLEATAYTRRCLYRVPRAGHWTAAEGLPGGEQATPREALLWEWLEPFQQQDQWELFLGLRADQRWSVYFDEQPVLQFNRHNQLRRLYAGGQRYAANGAKLQRLVRSSRGGRVRFEPTDLDAASQRVVLEVCQQFLEEAAQSLRSRRAQRVGLVPSHDAVWLPVFADNLQRVARELTLACSPAH